MTEIGRIFIFYLRKKKNSERQPKEHLEEERGVFSVLGNVIDTPKDQHLMVLLNAFVPRQIPVTLNSVQAPCTYVFCSIQPTRVSEMTAAELWQLVMQLYLKYDQKGSFSSAIQILCILFTINSCRSTLSEPVFSLMSPAFGFKHYI